MRCGEHSSPEEERGDGNTRRGGEKGELEGVSDKIEQSQSGKHITREESPNDKRNEEGQTDLVDFEDHTRVGEGTEITSTDETRRKEDELRRKSEKNEITKREEKEINTETSGEQQVVYWGVTGGGELPPSVSACFEVSPSLLARVQGRLLSLLGRANRYCLPASLPTPPAMPLEVLRRKVKEARHKLLHRSHPSSSKGSQKDKSSASESSSVSESSVPALTTRSTVAYCKKEEEPFQKYWGGEEGGAGAGTDEEIELLQQFLNLQHLARSRKHSAQLRRIRDSLLLQVRSRPNSLVVPYDPTFALSAQTPKTDMQQLRDFLLDIGFVQDYSLLNRHGYDLATAAHMDALDLAGAGVTEPLHRMALKHELNLVQQPLEVPEEVPETVEQWLDGIGLTDYVDNFHLNGIYCPLAAVNLTKRDLQLMGVYMQGHRKKILLSLAAMKETLFRPQ